MGKLNLPLEYSKLSQYFDVLSQSGEHSKNSAIEKILKRHKVKTVLDLTCGTGSQVFWLAKHGYQVTGADFSPALLEIARCKAMKEKTAIQFLEGDMRTIQVGQFDAVITISNAVGHLSKSSFEKAMRNIHKNLKEGGIYIFDIFNLDAMTDKAVDDLAMDVKAAVNDRKIHNIQYSKIDRDRGRLASFDQFYINEDSAQQKIIKAKFTLQIYTAKELREMLANNGFKTLCQYGIDGKKFFEKKTQSILTVAKKV